MEIKTVTYEGKEYEVNYDSDRDAVIVELEKPLEFGTEKYTEVVINNPTWEQLDTIDIARMTFPGIRKLAIKLTGLDSNRLGKIKGRDIRKIIIGVMYFLQQSLGDLT